MADNPAPGKTEIAMDLHLTDGRMDVLFDDVPVFGQGESLEAEASIITSFPANTPLGPGRNDIVIRFWPGDSKLNNEPGLKVRFGYSETGSFPDPFTDRPYAVLVEIKPNEAAPEGFRLDYSIKGQPLLSGKVAPELRQIADGGFEVELQLDVQVDLPEQKWKSGQVLHNDGATRSDMIGLMRRAHEALAAGPGKTLRELGPMIRQNAAAIGMTVEEFLQTEYGLMLDPSLGFKLQPFDATQSKLVIFGNGRLATLAPPPVRYIDEAAGESMSPFLAYWRDGNGNWQIIH